MSKSIATRFNWLVLAFYLGSLAIAAPLAYVISRGQAYDAASEQLRLLVNMVKAVRAYVSDDVRPPLLEAKFFHTPAISSTVATALVARRFLEKEPEYYIKVASDNPLNPKNKAEDFEMDLIERYRADSTLKEMVVPGELGGKPYLVSVSPSHNAKACLACHGKPDDAPATIKTAYGVSSGYNYGAEGAVVGVVVVGVPAGHIDQIALKRSLAVIGLLTAVFTVFFIAANIMMKRSVIQPLTRITAVAEAVSQGDLNTRVEVERNDEIGQLAHALELMRRSVVTMLRQSRK
jgi:methyl-accepting chemotaxis protein